MTTHDKRPLGSFSCDLPNGLTIVCGLNGVGKTTLLRLLHTALGGEPGALRDDLLDGGGFEISLELDGATLVAPIDDLSTVGVAYLDAADECSRMLALSKQENFDDLLEGFEAREWSPAEVAEARFVVGKHYETIRATEFDDPRPAWSAAVSSDNAYEAGEAETPVFALIEVEIGGLTYDFRTMGLGEFAALTLLWRLRRLRANTVVLLEEPETYLSARAGTGLVSVLAKTVNQRRLYAIVSTHSPGVIREAPLSAVRVLVPDGRAAALRPPTSTAEIEYLLGLPSGPSRIVLVEDLTAADFVRELVGRYAGAWVGDIDYLPTGGEEALIAVCRKLPATECIHLVGVLDGDQMAPTDDLNWGLLPFPWAFHRGSGGHRPLSVSMASAISALAL